MPRAHSAALNAHHGGQEREVRYEAKQTGASAADVKRAVKTEGNSRKKVEKNN